jgi:hypothetical protein
MNFRKTADSQASNEAFRRFIDVLIGGDREWADGDAAVEMGNELKL